MDMKTSPLAALADASLLKTDALIGGQWVAGGARFEVHDPATGQKLAEVANLGPAETKDALAAAERAWPAWRGKTAKERAAVLVCCGYGMRRYEASCCDLLHLFTACLRSAHP